MILPINNIFISNNDYLSDQEIIDSTDIRDYPSFLLTTKAKIKKSILKNNLIKDVKIRKKIGRTVYIDVVENTPLFYDDNKNIILENGDIIENKDFILPTLVNSLEEEMLEKLIKKYVDVDGKIRLLISEIKYVPNDIDKERFILTMNDGNYVYVTLYKMSAINEYIKILSKLENKKGILYLDSGNYFEIFK